MTERENLRDEIDKALAPIEPGGAWNNKSMETRQAVKSTGHYLENFGAQIADIGAEAIKLVGSTFPRVTLTSNVEATKIITASHQRLTELLSGTDSDVARSGLEKLGAAAVASEEINGAIYSGSQILAHRLEAKIKEVVDLATEIAKNQIWTPFLDNAGLEIIATGSEGSLPAFRAVAEPLEGGVNDIREFRDGL